MVKFIKIIFNRIKQQIDNRKEEKSFLRKYFRYFQR